MKTLSMLCLALIVCLCGATQDRGGAKPESNDCDLKKTTKGLWCEKCDKFVEKKDLDKKKKTCTDCETKPLTVGICVKVYYQAECHPDKTDVKPIKCCKKTHKTPQQDKARVAVKCSGCEATAATDKAVEHNDGCKKKKLVKVCTKSGEGRHVRKK